MLASRASVAVSAATATVAILGLLGRIELSLPAAVLLLVGARAAAAVAAGGQLGRDTGSSIGSLVPAWIFIVVAAAHRAGSSDLADIRGAHAVAGPSLTHGEPLVVIGCWLALLAAVGALAGSLRRPRPWAGSAPVLQAELLASVGFVLLAVASFAGPQVRRWADAAVWIGASLAVGGLATILATRIGPWAPRLATVVAAVAAVLVVVGR